MFSARTSRRSRTSTRPARTCGPPGGPLARRPRRSRLNPRIARCGHLCRSQSMTRYQRCLAACRHFPSPRTLVLVGVSPLVGLAWTTTAALRSVGGQSARRAGGNVSTREPSRSPHRYDPLRNRILAVRWPERSSLPTIGPSPPPGMTRSYGRTCRRRATSRSVGSLADLRLARDRLIVFGGMTGGGLSKRCGRLP
jgi:hypothetical protein